MSLVLRGQPKVENGHNPDENQALFLQLLNDQWSSVKSFDTFPLTTVGVQLAIVSVDVDEFKVVSFTCVVIVRIVARCDLHSTSTKLHVHSLCIGDYRQLSVEKWMLDVLSVQVGVSRVIWMDSNSRVTKDGLWTREQASRRNNLVVDFQIGQSSAELNRPVDQSQVTVDGSLFMQSDKSLGNCLRKLWTESEGFSGPVVRSTHHLELRLDFLMVDFLPVPHFFHKCVTAQIVSSYLLFGPQILLHNGLSSNTGMVETWQE
ncbi:hypothetical protein OGATHE_002924 [Ogataea polymorpha]|uniref:Uncharacterized protein n=1 Tax=Ogataea polymorpha TaxID=460523 RepID=A0A9P8T8S1_9ASCO|nr:hypothetical protein OGATHE_002924 [Ogataea polymorpha]